MTEEDTTNSGLPQVLLALCTDLCSAPQVPQVPSPGGGPGQGPYPYSLPEPALALDTSGKNLTEQNSYTNIPHEGKHTPLYERSSPINPAQSGSPNHVDSAYFPGSSTSSSSDNDEGSGGAAKWVCTVTDTLGVWPEGFLNSVATWGLCQNWSPTGGCFYT